ncbi:MAG: HAMP domain-containing histidine kinase [Oscillospiraceae bacterium]|nr:HAMP domain-containing histidine kinase [Oscillospiraceae bacterium]
MIKRLQIKFVAVIMVIVTVMLCVIFGLVYNFTSANLETQSINMMRTLAANPFHLGRPDEPGSDLRLPYFTLLLSKNGELLSTGGGYYDLSDEEFLEELIEISLGSKQESGVIREHNLRFCRTHTPMGTVLVFADMSSENSTLQSLIKTSILIGICSLAAFLVISIFLSRWAIRPVKDAWQQQKQFVADASHELKTPLTVITTNAELLQSDAVAEPDRLRFSQNILVMSHQMRSLLEMLLELARSDAGQHKQQLNPLDLRKLVMDAALSFEGVFFEKGLSLESSAESGISVLGSEQGLMQVMDILLDNAQKYSSPGGETVVKLFSSSQTRCCISVSNPGAPIPADDLKNIFKRFYRMDKARSRDGSFGLGLSIAENIVFQHKGKIWAESKNGYNTFFIELHKA